MDGWLDRIPVRLYYLQAFILPDIDLDFSAVSLDTVGQAVLDRWESLADMDSDDERQWVVEGLVAYVGETMLRLAGGGWRPEADGSWHLQADPALDLAPVSPYRLLMTTVRDQRPETFRQQYAVWEIAVAQRPRWTPIKEPTPGLDPVVPEEAEIRHLEIWLRTREQAFPRWASEFGKDVAWDFSPNSLDALAALVLRRTPTVEAFENPGNAPFVDGASWYLGEALRRVKGGRWNYRDGDPAVNLFDGYPFVEQSERDGNSAVPFRALRVMVKRGDPQHLRRRYEVFAE